MAAGYAGKVVAVRGSSGVQLRLLQVGWGQRTIHVQLQRCFSEVNAFCKRSL